MNAGFARSCITPPLGSPLQGLGQTGGCTAVREDLWVRALFLQHGRERALVLVLDLVFFERPMADRIKADVGRVLDLSPRQILLQFTHNHAGPRTSTWSYDQPDPLYMEKVQRACLDAATRAAARPRPVTLEAGQTHTTLPVSRRRPDAAGQAQWAPYPDGTICEALPVCCLRDRRGAVVSLLFSVSCHPSSWYENEICGDYPGVAVRLLNARFQTEGALFLQGCGGDTKPCTVAKNGQWAHGSWADVENAGRLVADAVAGCVAQGLHPLRPDLRSALVELPLPLGAPPAEAELRRLADDPAARAARRTWAADMLRRREAFGAWPGPVPLLLHALQLGQGLRLIALEGEPTADIGNLLLGAFAHGITVPLGYANGAAIYLPSDRQLPEHGYEVDSYWEYHWPAPLAPGIDAQLRRAVARLQADDITPDTEA